MNQFITVDKNSDEFIKYIEGTFSTTHIAVPVDGLSSVEVIRGKAGSNSKELMTFELIEQNKIKRPKFFEFTSELFKLSKFSYFIFPLFYLTVSFYRDQLSIDPWTMMLSCLGITFLFIAINLRSDYWDHRKGLDLYLKNKKSKVIENGWLRAITIKKLSYVFLSLSIATGLPVTIAYPKLIILCLISAFLILWGLFNSKKFFKDFVAGEVIWGVLIGPLLCIGYEMAVLGSFSLQTFLFGCLWGWIILYRLQLQNFEQFLESSLAKVKNLLTIFSFDKAKSILFFWWCGIIIFFIGYHLIYFHLLSWLSTVIILIYFTLKSYKPLIKLSSPTGSELSVVIKKFYELYVVLIMLWALQLLFSLILIKF